MKGNLWLGTQNGLFVFNPSTGHADAYRHSNNDPFSLPNNSIWYIYEDRQANVWIGTYSGKLCYVNVREESPFTTYNTQNSGLSFAPVSAFAEDRNFVYVGTEGGGVNRMDKSTGKIIPLAGKGQTDGGNVKSLLVDTDQNLWISTYLGGIDKYDSRRQKVMNYRHDKNNFSSLLENDVRKTILEADSGMWIVYQRPTPEITYYSFRDKTFSHIGLDKTDNYDYLFDVMRQGSETLWAISNEALYRMDVHTRRVDKIVPKDSVYLGLFTFCPDESGNLWIGTIGNGLVKYDINSSSFVSLKQRLPQEIYSIYSICYDDGNLWMGTDNGLCCYDIEGNSLTRFDTDENTQGQVYYPLAVMKGSDGRLYFGGTNGFTVVDPARIPFNANRPKAIISDFFISNEPAYPNYVMEGGLRTIVLDYDQTDFGFRFSSDNYYIPEKNRYRYRLKGYNNTWVTSADGQHTALYSKVPSGTYYFEVYAANNDGVWSESPTVIKIVRRTAPWFGWPAYVLYTLIAVGIIWLIYRYYADKKRLQMQLYHESIEKDKKEQIHQAQLRFFTNISHDFRTPLSLILAALEKLRHDGLKEYYYRILNSNAQRLLSLVNELMDFRVVENGKMQLRLQQVDVNAFIKSIAADFVDYARQRNIDYQIKCDEAISVYADTNVVEKIVMNLLNNAFKYTPSGGRILLNVRRGNSFESSYKNNYTVGDAIENVYSIIVSDTGVGISGESIRSVFERFYKVHTVNFDSHLGTGIGLALVKSLVLLHKGEITIHSERDKGTDMVACLPADPAVFAENDFMKPEENECSVEESPVDTGTLPSVQGQIVDSSSAYRLLIVEDNADLRALIAESLSADYKVMQAPDGLKAMELIAKTDFDLIVSDIMMPGMDGISLCQEVKTDINTSHIPVILLTAKTGMESKMEGADSGADLYLEKPIDMAYLKLSIANIFRNRQQLKEHYAKNYYADSSELSANEQDMKFMKRLVGFIEAHMDQPGMDVSLIAEELSMSRSKLYTKVKSLTGKSVVEFVLNCRLHKAAKLIIEQDLTMREVMFQIGIESQAYFTNSFKKVFGETPTAFAAKHKKG